MTDRVRHPGDTAIEFTEYVSMGGLYKKNFCGRTAIFVVHVMWTVYVRLVNLGGILFQELCN